MAEVQYHKCDFPGCGKVVEQSYKANIAYQRTPEEVKQLIDMAMANGAKFPEFEATYQSIVEKEFDLCKEHYDLMKETWFTEKPVAKSE